MAMAEMMPSPHDQGRRASIFSSPADFQNSAASGMYPTTGWAAGTTAPQNASLYTPYSQAPTPPQQPAGSYVGQTNVQTFLGSSFDGLSRTYDPYRGGGSVGHSPLGPPSIGQPSMAQSQGYTHYMDHDNQLGGGNLKMDPHMPRDHRQ
jgi:hypothetical protein